jgi:hypothetical protein
MTAMADDNGIEGCRGERDPDEIRDAKPVRRETSGGSS